MPKIPVDPLSVTPAWLSEVLEADVRECELEQIGDRRRAARPPVPGPPRRRTGRAGDGGRQAPHARHHGADEPLRRPRVLSARGSLLRGDRRRQPAAARHVSTSPRSTKRHTTSSSCSRIWAGSGCADQNVGCQPTDAETVIDAIARHHAYWWDNDRLASLPWLKTYNSLRFVAAITRATTRPPGRSSSSASVRTCPRRCVTSASGSRR